MLSSQFTSLTGQGVRVAIIDSGVNPAHPHVGGVAGGVGFTANETTENYLDYLGHGTAVAGAIREKAPDALLFAVKVFDLALRTNATTILRALDWAIDQQMDVVNLSLGTFNSSYRAAFEQIVARALERNVIIVAAHETAGQPLLPGSLPNVLAVELDWGCPRETFRVKTERTKTIFLASGYPRAIPGVKPEQNLNGISFAVANLTGFVTRARQAHPTATPAELEKFLVAESFFAR
jgi:subtilisin family serine protease